MKRVLFSLLLAAALTVVLFSVAMSAGSTPRVQLESGRTYQLTVVVSPTLPADTLAMFADFDPTLLQASGLSCSTSPYEHQMRAVIDNAQGRIDCVNATVQAARPAGSNVNGLVFTIKALTVTHAITTQILSHADGLRTSTFGFHGAPVAISYLPTVLAEVLILPPQVPGDCNQDQVVDAMDLSAWVGLRNLHSTDSGFVPACDMNHDGVISEPDYSLLAALYNSKF